MIQKQKKSKKEAMDRSKWDKQAAFADQKRSMSIIADQIVSIFLKKDQCLYQCDMLVCYVRKTNFSHTYLSQG